ncbi:MAG: EB domain-containing protein [Myxococcales bacterium]|nr:EB domain-containing protein [Myxococcales bacterium]
MTANALLRDATLLVAFSLTMVARAQPSEPPSATEGLEASPEAAAGGCQVACPPGYHCQNGNCYSACNPPCPVGTQCIDGGSCALLELPPAAPAATAPALPAQPHEPGAARSTELGPKSLQYFDGPVPDGYVVQELTVPGLWVPGLITFGVTYGVPAFIGLIFRPFDTDDTLRPLLLPLAGPFIVAARCDTCEVAPLIFVGLGQIVGVSLFTLGLTLKRRRFLREDLASWNLQPAQLGRHTPGLLLSGHF